MYQPMTIARLGELLAGDNDSERWLMIAEFLDEHRHEPRERRRPLGHPGTPAPSASADDRGPTAAAARSTPRHRPRG